MANTYRWYINELQTYPEFNGITNFVTNVIWRYNADNGSGTTANLFGQTVFNELIENPENPYVPYSSLTENEVVIWLETYNDVVSLQLKLDGIINEQINPLILNLPLPW